MPKHNSPPGIVCVDYAHLSKISRWKTEKSDERLQNCYELMKSKYQMEESIRPWGQDEVSAPQKPFAYLMISLKKALAKGSLSTETGLMGLNGQ